MLELFTTLSLAAGGILFLLLLLSLIGGLDLDFDLDTDTDTDGLGILKGTLAFIALGGWVVKVMLETYENPTLAFTAGALAGVIGVWLLSQFFRFLLSQQSNVNWTIQDALHKEGKVYLKIPSHGEGLVNIKVKGGSRELKASTDGGVELSTGTPIEVVDLRSDGSVVVRELL